MAGMLRRLVRTRQLRGDVMETELDRCLTTSDLCLIGIGSMVGSGMYVLTGEIANKVTGPAVVLSFLVAGVASGLSAWCYGEFGSRVPKAGSAYVYTYLTIGELAAFVIGWNMILEHVIGAAAIVRGLVGYINAITSDVLFNFSEQLFHTQQLDPFAPIIVLLVGLIVSMGVRHSTTVNNILTAVNISVALFVVVSGFFLADFSLWADGKFMPNGVGSVFEGAAQAYFAYVGYDSIAIASEEAVTPGFSIPFALAFDVFFVGLLYCSISAALTLMIPYQQIDITAAFAKAFDYNGWLWAKYVVSTGAVAAITCALLGMIFTMPRCIYAMASDGLVFRFLARVNPSTQVPVVATLVGCIFIAIFAFVFTLQELAEFMSIGTLLAYGIIALAVIVLRYSPVDPITGDVIRKDEGRPLVHEHGNALSTRQIALILGSVLLILALNFVLMWKEHYREWWFATSLVLLTVNLLVLLIWLFLISSDNEASVTCRVPFVPFLPALSFFVNIYLMLQLNVYTWIRFGVWMAVGFVIYFSYGIWNSPLETTDQELESKAPPSDQ